MTQTETNPAVSSKNESAFLNNSLDDFSLSERNTHLLNNEITNQNETSFNENNEQAIKQEIFNKQSITKENSIAEQAPAKNNIQNETNKDFSFKSHYQAPNETSETQPSFQNQNESILNESQRSNLKEGVITKERNQSIFKESSTESFIEEKETLAFQNEEKTKEV